MAEAQDLARRLHDEVRQRVLRRLLRTDADMVRFFDRLGARLRKRFRLVGMTEAEVSTAIAEEFRATEEELLPHVTRELEAAAQAGSEAARRTLEQLRGPEDAPDPFAVAPGSRPHPTRGLRLLRGSEGRSPETA